MVAAQIDDGDDPSQFFLDQDGHGQWRLRESHGRAGGTFTSCDAALRFVRHSFHAEAVVASAVNAAGGACG